MCRLFWSFAAQIYDEYLNHMNWYKQLGLILHYIPCFRAISEGSGETAQMFSLARSFAARICDMFHELAQKLWPEPSSTFLLL